MKQTCFSLFLILILSVALGGCRSSQSGLPKIDVQSVLGKARTYYNGGVTRETNITNLNRKAELAMNSFRTGAADLIANNQACFKSVADTETQIAQAVMSNMNNQAIFSALMTQSVSGEKATAECVKLNQQVADYIIAGRPAVMNAQLAAFEGATEYKQYTSNYPEVDFMNDFMQTYGDTALVYQKLADNGVGVSDWSWLPTTNLWVSHTDYNLCQYYISGEFMKNVDSSTKLKFTGHETSLARLYESTWNPAANNGRGECRMTRYAALEYMTRPIMSSDTQNVIESGQDQSIFPTEAP